MKEQMIHEKAIRLIEGGLVSVDGHCVRMKQVTGAWDVCMLCEMDCLCKEGSEMVQVCRECDDITGNHCYLILVTTGKMMKQ